MSQWSVAIHSLDIRDAVRQFFQTPTKKPRPAEDAELAGQARIAAIVRITKLLASQAFCSKFEGVIVTKHTRLTLSEAKQHGISANRSCLVPRPEDGWSAADRRWPGLGRVEVTQTVREL